MQQNIKKIILLSILTFFLTGCFVDAYQNYKYGEMVIDNWFNYKEGDLDLGKVRRSVEEIHEIKDVNCKFQEKYKTNYIFKCTLSYTKNSDTIIPFGEPDTKDLYAVFTPNNNTYTYKVYNSKSQDKIWEEDETLK